MTIPSAIVVDDFLDDPDATRGRALRSAFDEYVWCQPFPGRIASSASVSANVVARIQSHIPAPVVALDGGPANRKFAVHGRVQCAWRGHRALMDIHVDYFVDWTAFIYLSPKPPRDGGTTFWQHKSSGLWQWPTAREARALKAKGIANLQNYFHRDEGRARSRWTPRLTVSMEYNRLVLFPGTMFYSPTRLFGTSLDTGRMVQAFYFQAQAATAWPPPQNIYGCSEKVRRKLR